MTFDERLDQISQKHQALAETVQIIASMQLENEKAHRNNELLLEKNERLQEKNQILIADIMESVNSLARIAHAHENRITRLEDDRS